MKGDTQKWVGYAEENLRSATVLLDANLFNPCLQNIQQAVEKALKAVLTERDLPLKKTHSINELVIMLSTSGIDIDINEDECDLLDSVYLPSKYPLGSALPDFEPTPEICRQCLDIAIRVIDAAKHLVQ